MGNEGGGIRGAGTRSGGRILGLFALLSSACGSQAPPAVQTPPPAREVGEEAAHAPATPRSCPAEVVPGSEPSPGLVEALVPHGRWRVLGAHEQGLLVPARTRWGTLVAWSPIMGQLVFSDRLDLYAFASRGGSPWQPYFASSGDGHHLIRNWQRTLADGTIGHFDAASLGPAMSNRWGLSRMAHVVDVEVNGGRGQATDLHFVATDVRVLDRTAELPLDPERALDEAFDCFSELVSASRTALAAALERASAGEPMDASWGPEREQTYEAYAPTFDPDSRRLRVVHALRMVRTRTLRRTSTIVPHCPPGAPCMPPREEVTVSIRGRGADLVEEIEFDAAGRRVSVRAHGPVALAPEVLVRAGIARERSSP